MSQSRENLRTDGRTDGKADIPYFIGPLRPRPGFQKLNEISIFALGFGSVKSFMKVFKAFITPFEAPQRSVKIKI